VGKGQMALYNVLKAYSILDRSVGYVQGMGSIASLCLMYMPEEEAFWIMVRLLQSRPWKLEGLYQKGMVLAEYYLHIHQGLFKKHLPKLHAHFERENIIPSSYAFRWLTTRFSQFPLQTVVRIFDQFLFEGAKILFRMAIYCLKVREKDFLKMDFEHLTEDLNDLFRHPEFENADKVIDGCLDIKVTQKELKKLGNEYFELKGIPVEAPDSPGGSKSLKKRGSEKFEGEKSLKKMSSFKRGSASVNAANSLKDGEQRLEKLKTSSSSAVSEGPTANS